jgi:hypothetical protein
VAARVGAIDASSTIPLITGTADIVVLRSELVAPYCRLLHLVVTTVVVAEVVLQVDGIDGHEVRVARASDQLEVVRDGEVSDAVPAGVDGA